MIYDVEQYSEEWWKLRSGSATASMVWAIEKWCSTQSAPNGRKTREITVETAKGPKRITVPESSERANYRTRLLAQTLTGYQGEHEDDYQSKAMQWGTEFEATAKAQYEVQNGCTVGKMGFCTHPFIDRFGASPDGTVGSDGLIQLKCPNTTTHLNYRLDGIVPEEYEPQMQAELACTGRKWCDFVSFDPRLPKHLQLFVKRLERDEKRIKAVEAEVLAFLAELDALVAKLNGQEPSLTEQLEASLAAVTK